MSCGANVTSLIHRRLNYKSSRRDQGTVSAFIWIYAGIQFHFVKKGSSWWIEIHHPPLLLSLSQRASDLLFLPTRWSPPRPRRKNANLLQSYLLQKTKKNIVYQIPWFMFSLTNNVLFYSRSSSIDTLYDKRVMLNPNSKVHSNKDAIVTSTKHHQNMIYCSPSSSTCWPKITNLLSLLWRFL